MQVKHIALLSRHFENFVLQGMASWTLGVHLHCLLIRHGLMDTSDFEVQTLDAHI